MPRAGLCGGGGGGGDLLRNAVAAAGRRAGGRAGGRAAGFDKLVTFRIGSVRQKCTIMQVFSGMSNNLGACSLAHSVAF